MVGSGRLDSSRGVDKKHLAGGPPTPTAEFRPWGQPTTKRYWKSPSWDSVRRSTIDGGCSNRWCRSLRLSRHDSTDGRGADGGPTSVVGVPPVANHRGGTRGTVEDPRRCSEWRIVSNLGQQTNGKTHSWNGTWSDARTPPCKFTSNGDIAEWRDPLKEFMSTAADIYAKHWPQLKQKREDLNERGTKGEPQLISRSVSTTLRMTS